MRLLHPLLSVTALVAMMIAGCRHTPRGDADAGDHGSADGGSGTGACARLGAPTPLGTFVTEPTLSEVSGLAVSATDPDLLWVHNDSGDGPRLYGLARGGALRATFELTGVSARDFEDLARGPCSPGLGASPGASCLFVGDIGDNRAAYPSVTLHILTEPDLAPGESPASPRAITPLASVTLRYEDGPRDAEGLVVDPRGRVFVITKGREGPPALYRIDGTLAPGATLTLRRVFTFAADDLDPSSPLVTAADLSPGGGRLLLRTYASLLLLTLPASQTPTLTAKSLAEGSIRSVPVASEPQGEAVAWEPDGAGYLTASEQVGTISRVACTK